MASLPILAQVSSELEVPFPRCHFTRKNADGSNWRPLQATCSLGCINKILLNEPLDQQMRRLNSMFEWNQAQWHPQDEGSSSSSVESRGKRPFKVWDVGRSLRKSLVVNTLKELEIQAKEKLGIPPGEPVRLVLETDGTQVEDGEYFQTLPNNTVILVLRQGERWYPEDVKVDVTKTAIPKIVCATMHALELQNETSSWKIMDNKGRVTVVLHWDQRSSRGDEGAVHSSEPKTPKKQPSLINLIIQTGADPGPSCRIEYPPRRTIFNHDDIEAGSSAKIHVHTPECAHHSHQPSTSSNTTQGSSIESANIHVHTPESAHHAHQPSTSSNTTQGSSIESANIHVHTPESAHHAHQPSTSSNTTQGSSIESANIHVHTPESAHHAHQPSTSSNTTQGSSIESANIHVHTPESAHHAHQPSTSSNTTQGSSIESANILVHTPECAHHAHQPSTSSNTTQGSSIESANILVHTPECAHHAHQPSTSSNTTQGSSIESANIHVHTAECAHHAHQPTASRAGSPVNECEFHCNALHKEGRKITAHKSVATSPIHVYLSASPQQHPSSNSDPSKREPSYSKRHVRFLDIEGCSSMTHQQLQLDHESSESDTESSETTIIECLTYKKFLLLQAVDVKKHLSIKDIGIILERLSCKIIDVEYLDRETESDDVFNWTIKATIRGELLRELGVIYNGNYYAISEHPGYREESEEARDDNEDTDEEEAVARKRSV